MDPFFSSNECYMQCMRSIEETLTRMYYAVDTKQFDMLTSKVFAPEVTFDYTAMFGGEPRTRTAAEQTENWRRLMGKGMEATQHTITGVLPLDMEWPNGKSSLDRDTVTVHAHVQAYLRRRSDDGKVLETRNAGRGEIVMQRLHSSEYGEKTLQWRIRRFKVFPTWDQGGQEFWKDL